MDPVEPGLTCGSETTHLSLLAYDPRRYYRGRGAFESMGADLAMAPATSSSRYATEHRCGVVVKGPKLSGNISGTDPLKDNRPLLKAEALDDTEEAKHTAAVVNELSKEISKILIAHPLNAKRAAEGKSIANVVLLRGCGIRIEGKNAAQEKDVTFTYTSKIIIENCRMFVTLNFSDLKTMFSSDFAKVCWSGFMAAALD